MADINKSRMYSLEIKDGIGNLCVMSLDLELMEDPNIWIDLGPFIAHLENYRMLVRVVGKDPIAVTETQRILDSYFYNNAHIKVI